MQLPPKNVLITPSATSKVVLDRARSYAPSLRGFRLATAFAKAEFVLLMRLLIQRKAIDTKYNFPKCCSQCPPKPRPPTPHGQGTLLQGGNNGFLEKLSYIGKF